MTMFEESFTTVNVLARSLLNHLGVGPPTVHDNEIGSHAV